MLNRKLWNFHMDIVNCLALLFFFLLFAYKFIADRVQLKNLPPGPRSLPILGNYYQLKRPIHLFFQSLSVKYGPIFLLRFGSRPVLVISSPSAVEECFTKNDIIFANRPHFNSRKTLEYDFTTIGAAPYGNHWRNLRRLTTLEIFSSRRLHMSSNIRTEEIRFLIKQLFKSSLDKEMILETEPFFYMLTFNVMMQMIAAQRYFTDAFGSEKDTLKLNDLKQMFSSNAQTTLSDHLPFLWGFTFSKIDKKNMEDYRKREQFLQELINSCRDEKSRGKMKQSLIDILLSLQDSEPDIYTEDVIRGIIVMMLVSGSKTSASTMEAAISHLTEYPEVFQKAREEIDNNVGQSRLLDDSDLSKLPFLDCIIYETIRLGSTGPIIPPHESREECVVGSYNIPKGTMLVVNAWALQRDPKLWENPDGFQPERFHGKELKDEGYKLIPFGFGRRRCPGSGLAMRMMALSLGTLIQCFDLQKAAQNVEGETPKTSSRKSDERPGKVSFRPREALVGAVSLL